MAVKLVFNGPLQAVASELRTLAAVAMLCVVLFFALDSYYLGLERLFRKQYNAFVKKLQTNTAQSTDLFEVNPFFDTPKKKFAKSKTISFATLESAFSIAVIPFYALIILTLFIVQQFFL